MINLLSGSGYTFIKKPFERFTCDACGALFESDEYVDIRNPEADSNPVAVGEDCPICSSFCTRTLHEDNSEERE